MARKIKTFLSKLSENEIYDTLGDPYSLNAPTYYTSSKNFDGKGNFPRSYIEEFVRVHKSNFRSHKTTIYVQGKPVKSLKAVSNEFIVWYLISKFGLHEANREAILINIQKGRIPCNQITTTSGYLKVITIVIEITPSITIIIR